MLEGMLWVLRTGAPWRDLPERFGSWKAVSSRFYRWRSTGVWDQVLAELQRQADRNGDLDWTLHFVVSTTVRAHQHAAGAKGAPESEAFGRSRGGLTTKIHVRAERQGKPVVIELTPGEWHEQPMVERLMERGALNRDGRGRSRLRPQRVAGDKAYSSAKVRHYLCRRGIGAVIPRKSNEQRKGRFDRQAYRERNVVERLINRLKQHRRVATRYEKQAANYRAMASLACILLWL